ncbi:MAG: hypothetical protein IAE89_15740 [Anaerolineae bacterium]|nr:hypothetical protein [Anaerolineae bacterium]
MNDRRKNTKNNAPQNDDVPVETIAETENYIAWLSHEPDGETVYHLELGSVTLHFFREEFQEVLDLIADAGDALA